MPGKLTKREAAEFLGMSEKTLSNRLSGGTGPRSYKYLGRVYFDRKDLEAFKRSLIEVRAG